MNSSSDIVLASGSVLMTAVLGSYFTSQNTNTPWYDCIKPSIAPPSYVFPIAWTTLYILITIAFSRSMSNIAVRNTFIINLVLNVLWCYLYFGQKQLTAALFVILLLWITIVRIIYISDDIITQRLMYPYLAWITFATILNWLSISKAKKC